MGYLVQKAAVSGKFITFPSPTTVGNLLILVATWAEDGPAGTQLEFGTPTPLCNFVTDDGANTWRQARDPDTNSIIMAVVSANSCQTITTDPHYFTTNTDTGPASPAGLRLRAYEVSNIPGPGGHLPEGSTNIQENGCVGIGHTTPNNPQVSSVNPAGTILAASWSDMIGDNGFFIFVLSPNGGAGSDNFSGNVTSVAAPAVLDDPFGPTAVAYIDGQSADSNQTATFAWTNTAGWSVQAAAWEAFGAVPTTGTIVITKNTIPSGSPQLFTFHPNWEGSFSLNDAQSHISTNLAPGSYSITEDAVPNWTTTTNSDPSAIVVTAGATTTVSFTNTFVSPIPPPGPVCYADGIIPTGSIDGVNTSFTLPSAPNPPGSLILESDTSLLAPGAGFNLNFVLNGTQLTLVYPPKTSLVAWYRIICGAHQSIPPLYKLNPDQAFDDNAFTSTPTAINSTYFTYGFVNAAKSAQNPLLGFHRKRFSEIQMNVNGSGQFIVTTFPNYILKKDLSYNPYAYVVPPILLQTDPPDDLIRPLNSVGNRVYVKFETNAVGASFDISKTILCGVIDAWATVNPNSG